MSRLGKKAIEIPEGVKTSLEGGEFTVNGPKGSLKFAIPEKLAIEENDGFLVVKALDDKLKTKALHGTTRAVIANMVKGVTEGWSKILELVGTGFRAQVNGQVLILSVGYSHPVKIDAPEGITFKIEKSEITVEGIDREKVGLLADRIRRVRPPEPYKGKGIKYKDEIVRRKAGKAAKAQGAAS